MPAVAVNGLWFGGMASAPVRFAVKFGATAALAGQNHPSPQVGPAIGKTLGRAFSARQVSAAAAKRVDRIRTFFIFGGALALVIRNRPVKNLRVIGRIVRRP